MCFKKLYKKWLFNRFVKKQVKEMNERIDPSLRKMSDEIWGELKRENAKAMEIKFTKGKWDVRGLCVGVGGCIIAPVQDGINFSVNVITDKKQAEANAKLIAASPDLYHALDELIKNSSKFFFKTQEDYDTWADLKEKAVKALRKAEEGERL